MAPLVIDLTFNDDEDERSPAKAAASALKSFLPRSTKQITSKDTEQKSVQSSGGAWSPVSRISSSPAQRRPVRPSPKEISEHKDDKGVLQNHIGVHDESGPPLLDNTIDEIRRIRAHRNEQSPLSRTSQVDYELPSGFRDYAGTRLLQRSEQQPKTTRNVASVDRVLSISPGRQVNKDLASGTADGGHGHLKHFLDVSPRSTSIYTKPVVSKGVQPSASPVAGSRDTSMRDDGEPIDLRPYKRRRIEDLKASQSVTRKSALDHVPQQSTVHAPPRHSVDGVLQFIGGPSNDESSLLKEDQTDQQLFDPANARDVTVKGPDVGVKAKTVTRPYPPTKRISAAAQLAESLLNDGEEKPVRSVTKPVLHGYELLDDARISSQSPYRQQRSDQRKKSFGMSGAGLMVKPDPLSSDGSEEKVKLGVLSRPNAQQHSTGSGLSPFLKSRNNMQPQISGGTARLPKRLPVKNNANTVHGTPYSAEEDALLVELKEVRDVPWDQMEQHFNGRTRGSLQVRYSTKLKNRSNISAFATAETQRVKENSGSGSVTPLGPSAGRPQRVSRNNEAYAGDGFVSWAEIKRRRLVEELESQEQLAEQSPRPTQSIPQFTTERVFTKSLSMIMRQRELGTNFGRSWAPTLVVPRELKEHVHDDIGPRRFFMGTSSDVTCVAWAPDGRQFAASSIAISDDRSMQYNKSNNLLLGDFERSTLVELPEHHIQRPVVDETSNVNGLSSMRQTQDSRLFMTVANVQFSPDSQVLYSAGSDRKARAYRFDKGVDKYRCIYELEHPARVDLLSVSNHDLLATACHQSTDGSIHVYNDEMLALSLSPSRNDSQINRSIYPSALRWGTTPRLSNFLLAGFSIDSTDDERDFAGETCLWDVASERRLELYATTRNVFDVAWNPVPTSASHVFAVASTPGSSKVNRRTRSIVQCFAPKQGSASRVLELECPAFDINDVVYCPYDDNLLAVGATDGKVYVWDQRYANNRQMPLHIFEHEESLNVLDHDRDCEIADTGIRFLSWGATSTRLYSGSSDGCVKIWNPYMANENAHVKDVATFSSAVMSGSFSPDYRELLIGEDQGRLNLLSAGFNDKTVRSMEPFKYSSAPVPGTGSAVPESHAAAKELLDTQQIQLRHMGALPKKQAVQGVSYLGPYLSPTSEQMNAADEELKAAQEAQHEAHSLAASAPSQSSVIYTSVRAADRRVEQVLGKISALQLKADDAMILAPRALDLQRQFKQARNERRELKKSDPAAFKRCKLECAYTPSHTDEDGVPDNHRSEDRIPAALWPSKALDLHLAPPEDILEAGLTAQCTICFLPAPRPLNQGKPARCTKCCFKASGLTSSCKNCGTPVRLLDAQAKTGLCERCSFACFRCGRTAMLGEDLRHVACPRCDLVWSVGALGYELVRGRHKGVGESDGPRDGVDDEHDDNDGGEEFGEAEIMYYLSRCGAERRITT